MVTGTDVDVKQAVANASEYLVGLFPTGSTLELEEVESLDDGGWRVTLSYLRPGPDPFGLRQAIALQHGTEPRVYKVVTLDASGRPVSAKIR